MLATTLKPISSVGLHLLDQSHGITHVASEHADIAHIACQIDGIVGALLQQIGCDKAMASQSCNIVTSVSPTCNFAHGQIDGRQDIE